MPIKSLIGELPKIVADGNREAAAILDRLSSANRITLQTNGATLTDIFNHCRVSSAMVQGVLSFG